MQADLVSFGIDLFDLDDEVQGAAQDQAHPFLGAYELSRTTPSPYAFR